MPFFKKKPVVIEAIQYNGSNGLAIKQWSNGKVVESPVLGDNGPYLQIHTLEGVMTALVEDFIIRGVQGEYYPCKPDIFDATYEPCIEGVK